MVASTSFLLAAAAALMTTGVSVTSASPMFLEAAQAFISDAPSPSAASSSSSAAATASASAGIGGNANNGGGPRGNGTNPYISNGMVPVFMQCTSPGEVAITIDDGTQPSQAGLAKLFEDNGFRGTFFTNGFNYRCIYDPEMVEVLRDTYAAGHQIGNHGWGHDHSSLLSNDDFHYQVELVEEALIKILGIKPAHFRFPYGDHSDDNLRALAARNYSAAVQWDRVAGSGTGTSIPDSQAMFAQLAHDFPNAHITLSHEQDTNPYAFLADAIRELQAAGYKLVTASQCLGIPPYQWVGQPQQRDASWTCAGKPVPGAPHRH